MWSHLQRHSPIDENEQQNSNSNGRKENPIDLWPLPSGLADTLKVFLDEDTGAITVIDVGGMSRNNTGIESDCQRFRKSMDAPPTPVHIIVDRCDTCILRTSKHLTPLFGARVLFLVVFLLFI